jgi:hypothetical protein
MRVDAHRPANFIALEREGLPVRVTSWDEVSVTTGQLDIAPEGQNRL